MSYPHLRTECHEYHGLVRDFDDITERPTITVLCGSTRFGDAFRKANLELTLRWHIVLSIGCDTKSDDSFGWTEEQAWQTKQQLDALHKRKIDLADEVYVLNVDGYIGESTRSEIKYAVAHGKPITYLVPIPEVRDTEHLSPPAALSVKENTPA